MKRIRLDKLLVDKGLASDIREAAVLAMAGEVFVDGVRADKPGMLISSASEIKLKSKRLRYVSRGGLKLEAALSHFEISVQNKVCADLGASTGGFTDCLLQRGARLVYTFDVGSGQLDWKLQNDPRVIQREGVNVRFLRREMLQHSLDLVTIDVSFISLTLVLPAVRCLEPGEVLALVKPQFEAERWELGKGGIVRSDSTRQQILERVARAVETSGWRIPGIHRSPILGQKGNQEYFFWLKPVLLESSEPPA